MRHAMSQYEIEIYQNTVKSYNAKYEVSNVPKPLLT